MVSWQAFSSLPPRAPLAFLSHLKLPFPSLSNACHAGPFPSLSNACHAGYYHSKVRCVHLLDAVYVILKHLCFYIKSVVVKFNSSAVKNLIRMLF